MMRHFVRGVSLLLLLGLAGASLALDEIRFVLAGASISGLVEIALALRARRNQVASPRDRSRVAAAQVSCTEQDGALTVSLVGEPAGREPAPYVLLARTLRTYGETPVNGRAYLELSDPKWSVHGGVQEAHLSPRLLRLALDARGAEALGASEVCVTLQAGCDQRRLERALGKILRGIPFTSERSLPEDVPDSSAAMAR